MVTRALLVALFIAGSGTPLAAASFTVPAGTVLNCRLAQTLTTQINSPGQDFAATVTEPLVIDGEEAIPIGATVRGRITTLSRPGRIKGVGEMMLSPETIAMPNGQTFTLKAVLLHAYGAPGAQVADTEGLLKGGDAHKADLTEIGIGTGGGTFIGLLVGGLKGGIVGGVVGGGAALVDRLRRRGPDLALPTGTELKFQLTRQLVVMRFGAADYKLSSREK